MRNARMVIGILLLLFSLDLRALAATYILETRLGVDPAPLASRYQFLVQKSWKDGSHSAHAIAPITDFSASQLKALRSESGVLEVEVNREVHAGEPELTPSGKLEPLGEQLLPRPAVSFFGATVRASYVDQPAVRIVGAPEARRSYPTGGGIVAVIDTGVDEKHPALKGVLMPGYDFTRDLAGTASEFADLDQSTVAILDQSTVAILDGKNFPVRLNQSTVAILDQSTVAILDGKLPRAFGHGTMVAGLVHAIAPTARILPLKAFRADGSSSLSDIVRAIYYAADRGANVINLSFNLDTPSPELANAVAYATSKGVLCVASGGNDGKSKKVYPAALPHVLGVGSTNYSDRRSIFSNYGSATKVAAPGEAVITTFPGNNYAAVWGTSFSTPMISGSLAVMRDLYPRLDYDAAHDALERGVELSADMGQRLSLPPTLNWCVTRRY